MFISHTLNNIQASSVFPRVLTDLSSYIFSPVRHTLRRGYGCLSLSTADVASQIIKVDVAPSTRAVVNQPDLGAFTNESCDIPGPGSHRLCAFAGRGLNHLKFGEQIYHLVTVKKQFYCSPIGRQIRDGKCFFHLL